MKVRQRLTDCGPVRPLIGARRLAALRLEELGERSLPNAGFGPAGFDAGPPIERNTTLAGSRTAIEFGGADVGTFAPTLPPAQDAGRWSFAPADLNADGELDVLVADRESNAITSWMREPGKTTFTPGPFRLGAADGLAGPANLVLADLDGRFGADLLVANSEGDAIAVYLRTADQTFVRSPRLFPTGDRPGSLAVGDLNNDLRPEVVVANRGSGDLTILEGGLTADGGWTFNTNQRLPMTGTVPVRVYLLPPKPQVVGGIVVLPLGPLRDILVVHADGQATRFLGSGAVPFGPAQPEVMRLPGGGVVQAVTAANGSPLVLTSANTIVQLFGASINERQIESGPSGTLTTAVADLSLNGVGRGVGLFFPFLIAASAGGTFSVLRATEAGIYVPFTRTGQVTSAPVGSALIGVERVVVESASILYRLEAYAVDTTSGTPIIYDLIRLRIPAGIPIPISNNGLYLRVGDLINIGIEPGPPASGRSTPSSPTSLDPAALSAVVVVRSTSSYWNRETGGSYVGGDGKSKGSDLGMAGGLAARTYYQLEDSDRGYPSRLWAADPNPVPTTVNDVPTPDGGRGQIGASVADFIRGLPELIERAVRKARGEQSGEGLGPQVTPSSPGSKEGSNPEQPAPAIDLSPMTSTPCPLAGQVDSSRAPSGCGSINQGATANAASPTFSPSVQAPDRSQVGADQGGAIGLLSIAAVTAGAIVIPKSCPTRPNRQLQSPPRRRPAG